MKNAQPNPMPGFVRPGRSHAFTLIEILIVVVILGILASLVVPQFSNASTQARENAMKENLRYLRAQIVVFKAQHRDLSAGYLPDNSAPSANMFIRQMTRFTDELGNVSDTASSVYKYGPYLDHMPANPFNNFSTIKIVSGVPSNPQADNKTGWIYYPDTQQIMANTSGVDSYGAAYIEY